MLFLYLPNYFISRGKEYTYVHLLNKVINPSSIYKGSSVQMHAGAMGSGKCPKIDLLFNSSESSMADRNIKCSTAWQYEER